jgi:Protein of unknown function, DUF547
MPRLLVVLLLGGLLAPPMAAAPAGAAPEAELWARWERHDPSSTVRVDHGAWARFLQLYLRRGGDGIARVDYGAVTAADLQELAGYVATLAAVPVSRLNRDEQMAYWINLYNALTVQVVLERYPVRSIRDVDISPGLFSRGPWGRKLVAVEGEPVSLDDIEHRILRPIWRDPRVHYAVNCASLGCPDLPPRPLAAHDLDHALDMAAIAFVNHPRGVRIDDGVLLVSSIYVWFEEDFGGDDAGVIRHLMAYADPDLAMRLQRLEEIGGDSYDWRLNDAGQNDR